MSAFKRIKFKKIDYEVGNRKTPIEIPVVMHSEGYNGPTDTHMDAIAALVMQMNHMRNKVTRMEKALEKIGIKPWP